ncbi:hypothetical protein F0562_013325 [Nyssa sinensis]|uniref:Uncharacterized protein n=1 Tax=Nyssa sinensis TaxID=561372 RepID=A0A5J4ZMA3_9ASTE|nr:hypothetical protein F0562_013325 [Nyssa sinensis]
MCFLVAVQQLEVVHGSNSCSRGCGCYREWGFSDGAVGGLVKLPGVPKGLGLVFLLLVVNEAALVVKDDELEGISSTVNNTERFWIRDRIWILGEYGLSNSKIACLLEDSPQFRPWRHCSRVVVQQKMIKGSVSVQQRREVVAETARWINQKDKRISEATDKEENSRNSLEVQQN